MWTTNDIIGLASTAHSLRRHKNTPRLLGPDLPHSYIKPNFGMRARTPYVALVAYSVFYEIGGVSGPEGRKSNFSLFNAIAHATARAWSDKADPLGRY